MASKEYWVDLAEYDLAAAQAMLNTKRYLILRLDILKQNKSYWKF